MLATAVPLFLIFILFLLKIVEVGMDWDFSHMGIYPLEKRGITGILTHPPDSGFTVTDSRGFAPSFPLPPEAAKAAQYEKPHSVYHSAPPL